jgi:nicotinate dehydrogenase subunit A
LAQYHLNVNGSRRTVTADPDQPLLYALRDDMGLDGPKFGCGLAQCGACTVLMDGAAVRSCSVPLAAVADSRIETVESLGTVEKPGVLARAFVAEQAAQCGYCIPGMMMSATALLRKNKRPTEDQIKKALAGNLCRCGTHLRILRAVARASRNSA